MTGEERENKPITIHPEPYQAATNSGLIVVDQKNYFDFLNCLSQFSSTL